MGLLDFAMNVGAELFQSEEEAAAKVKAHIEANNPGIEGLEVEVKDGVAMITGVTADYAAAEKAILMIGNVKGIKQVGYNLTEKSAAPAAAATPAPEAAAEPAAEKPAAMTIEMKTYEIKSGDTLSAIAKQVYGDASKYPKLLEANKEVIIDADKIYPGQVIRIPELS